MEIVLPSLKLTAKAPENGWLEQDRFLLGPGLFSGAFADSFGERVDLFLRRIHFLPLQKPAFHQRAPGPAREK